MNEYSWNEGVVKGSGGDWWIGEESVGARQIERDVSGAAADNEKEQAQGIMEQHGA
jgi:hypothetical protein